MEDFGHIIGHAVEHTFADTLYLIPFLFVTYLAMEWLEHKTGSKTQEAVRRAGAAGPAVGALVGVVPQCGFSAVSATLWAGRVITLGTLFAVFLSTSDEMLPIFLAEQVPLPTILKILGVKLMIGMVMGFLIDAVVRIARRDNNPLRIHELCEQDSCHCEEDCAECGENPGKVYEHFEDEACAHTHDHSHDHAFGWKIILKSALAHTVQVTAFILVITLALNLAIEGIGEDALGDFLVANESASVFLAGLVGLVPNCAASVVIAQLYLDGVLGAGAMLAGLLVGAGVGLLVLARSNRHAGQNIAIVCALYATGVFWGLLVNVFGIAF
ncbi:putative manganese transporter [Xiamenia xianingshaonis]|uniref:Arsenic efflux protein n=1 Tax=Xiamenia xianingshaonis TaxID=2682776 RepID=A0A9E6MPL3_9ACTN|nr:putative manganese transporter [Xiamenia xianingshaonis]NHM14302.1 hypothetical protein [Xiamenia xianingshaonis]QTU84089.1 arsenic efflux protein [Xiamenia xianingshaonis]